MYNFIQKDFNMSCINLDERLSSVANYVRNGKVVADIGTDHAYLPVFLIQNGICNKALACDINIAPLESAKKTVSQYNLNSQIELRLSNGLEKISENECDDIVIAGMGGDLIATILDNCNWVKSEKYNLILNPMTKGEKLRLYLLNNGFSIINETAVISNNKRYSVINSQFSGNIKTDIPMSYLFCGELIKDNSQNALEYKKMVAIRLEKRLNGLRNSNTNMTEQNEIEQAIKEILN